MLAATKEMSATTRPQTVLAKTTTAPVAPGKVQQKLTALSERFEGFEDELLQSKEKKKSDDEKKIKNLQTQLENLNNSLQVETRNRSAAMQAMQSWLTDRFAQFRIDVETPILARLDKIDRRLDGISERVERVEKAHEEDRERFPDMINTRCGEILKGLADLKLELDVVHKSHEEKEKKILVRLNDQHITLLNQFAADKAGTDKRLLDIRRDLEDEAGARTRSVDMIREEAAAEAAAVRGAIAKEIKDREAAQEEILQGINHYSSALQDGIKIVSTS